MDRHRQKGGQPAGACPDGSQSGGTVFLPFEERYPFLKLQYSRGSEETRIVRTLVALRSGKHVTDVLTGLSGAYFVYKEANALEDLRNIPTGTTIQRRPKTATAFRVGQRSFVIGACPTNAKVKIRRSPKKTGRPRKQSLLAKREFRDGSRPRAMGADVKEYKRRELDERFFNEAVQRRKTAKA